MADQIDEIRGKIDLVQLIAESVPLKKAGRNFKGLCPFHAEKTPSFIVSPERQIWKCFGCGAGGDVFKFVTDMERIEFGEALRLLAKRAGVILESYQPTQSESGKEKLYQINHLAAEYFHFLLLNHPIGKRGLDYILGRGIAKDSLALFKIGYSPPLWDGLQKYLVEKKGFSPNELESAGLIIPTSHVSASPSRHYDRFRDRLMFPLANHRGNITGFAGRVLDPEVREAKYVNTPETLVYHKSELLYPLQITKEEIKKANTAVVVEGELDAISCYQAGIKNVVAIKGSALTESQVKLLKRYGDSIILSLDMDVAGDLAARRGIEMADAAGLNIKVTTLEKYKDPDEAAQKEPEYLRERINAAENIYDFYLDSAFKRFRGKTAEEKRKIGQELVPILAKIEDEIVKNLFVKKLAGRLSVNEESIILQLGKTASKSPSLSRPATSQPSTMSQKEVLEEYLLSLALQSKKVAILLEAEVQPLFSSPVAQKLILLLAGYLKEEKQFSSQFFFKTLPAELREAFDRLYLIDFGEKIDDEDWVGKEISKTKSRLEVSKIKEDLRELGRDEKDQEKVLRLAQRLAALEKSL